MAFEPILRNTEVLRVSRHGQHIIYSHFCLPKGRVTYARHALMHLFMLLGQGITAFL